MMSGLLRPMSYAEFLTSSGSEDSEGAFSRYFRFGGLCPYSEGGTDAERDAAVAEVYRTALGRAGEGRSPAGIRLLDGVARFLFRNTGDAVSLWTIGPHVPGGREAGECELISCVRDLEASGLVIRKRGCDLMRADQAGDCFYAADVGMRNAVIGMTEENGRSMETLVFLELLHRGYDVRGGTFGAFKVDFIAKKGDRKILVQTVYSFKGRSVERAMRPFAQDPESYERLLISRDRPDHGMDGVVGMGIREFLLSDRY
jgi:predicted AAA+ superfamily ATPase